MVLILPKGLLEGSCFHRGRKSCSSPRHGNPKEHFCRASKRSKIRTFSPTFITLQSFLDNPAVFLPRKAHHIKSGAQVLRPIRQGVLLHMPLLSKQGFPSAGTGVWVLCQATNTIHLVSASPQSQPKVNAGKKKLINKEEEHTERQCAYKAADFQILSALHFSG